MITLLSRIFLKNKENDRTAWGTLCGWVGIFLNLCLSGIKLIAATITGSVSIMADAFNNLSDAGSSLITILGFRLAAKKPDRDHPFGHGRMEYISALIVSMLICLMGFELGKSSVEKIISGETSEFSLVSVIILASAIAVKLYMYAYNKSIGKKIKSEALFATANDSLSDCVATSVVLVCSVISHFTSLSLDGWCGIAVALFILRAGITTATDTIEPLLGKAPEPELVNEIRDTVMQSRMVTGIHDLVVHDYGPGRLMITLHAEVPCDCNILEAHDEIDNIEVALSEKLNCMATIHMDPVSSGDEIAEMKKSILTAIHENVGRGILIHDLRIVDGATHTNVIFDAVVPFELKLTENEAREKISAEVKKINGKWNPVVTIDRPYANETDGQNDR